MQLPSPKYAIAAWAVTCAAHGRPVLMDRTVYDATIFVATTPPAVPDAGLLRQLNAGDVSELKPIEQSYGFTRTLPLPDVNSREVRIDLDVPTKVLILEGVEASTVELSVYSSEPLERLGVVADGAAVRLAAGRPADICALSLVRDAATSVLGTCGLVKVAVVPGGRVSIYVNGEFAGASRAATTSVTPPR